MKQVISFIVLSALTLLCSGQVNPISKATENQGNATGKSKITNPEKNTPWPYKHSVNCSIQDKNGDIWFGTTDGLYRYNGKMFTNYKTIEGISFEGMTKMIEDKAGNIWFGAAGGIIRYNILQSKSQSNPSFTGIKLPVSRPNVNFSESLKSNLYGVESIKPVNQLMEDCKGIIWFTVGYHLYYIDKVTDDVRCTAIGNYLRAEKMQMSKGDPDDFGITAMCEDPQANIMIGVGSCGCCYTVTYKISRERLDHPCILNNCHHDLSNTKDLAIHNSEILLSLKKITHENMNMSFGAVLKDRHSNMWFGGVEQGGLYMYDGEHFIRCMKNEALNKSIISTIFEDSKGNIWTGTFADSTLAGNGVFRYNPYAKGVSSITHYTIKDGLCSNHPFSNDVITSINEDNTGKMWFGGDPGICYYATGMHNAGNDKFTNFREEEGMNDDHINFILKARSGEIWLGTWNLGIYKYDGKKLISFNN